jgi:hypothetical protein
VQLITAGSITKWKNCVKIVAANKGDVVDCEISPELKRKRGRQPNAASAARRIMVHVQERALVAVGHLLHTSYFLSLELLRVLICNLS